MDPEKAEAARKKAGSRGGHRFTAEEAAKAGKKSGKLRPREHMAKMGRASGKARRAKKGA